jgi:hypothetical protein
VGVNPGGVVGVATTSNSDVPECDYTVSARHLKLAVTLDSEPQAYFRLERTAVEASQQFGTVRVEPAPEAIVGLGLDAWWFPGERKVMTTDGVRLITVSVRWPEVGKDRERALGKSVARVFLGPLHPEAAKPNGS